MKKASKVLASGATSPATSKASSNVKAVDVTFTSKEVSTFSRLELGITFRRRHVYHVVNTFIPAFLFFLISYCGFWIDRKSAPARVAVCVLPVLITHNFVNHVASTLSLLPYFTVLNTYLTCLYLFGVSACIEYAAVQYHLSREAVAVATLPKLAALRHNLETMFTSDEIAAAEANLSALASLKSDLARDLEASAARLDLRARVAKAASREEAKRAARKEAARIARAAEVAARNHDATRMKNLVIAVRGRNRAARAERFAAKKRLLDLMVEMGTFTVQGEGRDVYFTTKNHIDFEVS